MWTKSKTNANPTNYRRPQQRNIHKTKTHEQLQYNTNNKHNTRKSRRQENKLEGPRHMKNTHRRKRTDQSREQLCAKSITPTKTKTCEWLRDSRSEQDGNAQDERRPKQLQHKLSSYPFCEESPRADWWSSAAAKCRFATASVLCRALSVNLAESAVWSTGVWATNSLCPLCLCLCCLSLSIFLCLSLYWSSLWLLLKQK